MHQGSQQVLANDMELIRLTAKVKSTAELALSAVAFPKKFGKNVIRFLSVVSRRGFDTATPFQKLSCSKECQLAGRLLRAAS